MSGEEAKQEEEEEEEEGGRWRGEGRVNTRITDEEIEMQMKKPTGRTAGGSACCLRALIHS